MMMMMMIMMMMMMTVDLQSTQYPSKSHAHGTVMLSNRQDKTEQQKPTEIEGKTVGGGRVVSQCSTQLIAAEFSSISASPFRSPSLPMAEYSMQEAFHNTRSCTH